VNAAMSKACNDQKHTRNSNGEGSIFQRSDKRWCAQIQVDGIIRSFYGIKRSDAAKMLSLYKETLRKKPWNNNGENTKVTVEEFITWWLVNVKLIQLKPTSYDRLECTVKNQIIPRLGSYRLNELTTQIIQEKLIDDLFKRGYSFSHVKKAYLALNACCKYALLPTVRKLDYNPVSGVVLPNSWKFDSSKIRWLNRNEIRKFKKVCISKHKNGKYCYPLGYGMIFIMNTGLRLCEALALRWKDVNWKERRIDVSHNVVTAVDRNSTTKKRIQINQRYLKTRSSKRILPLNNTAYEALTKIKEFRYFGENSYILCTKNGTQNKPRNFCRTFESIIKRAGIEKCGIHALRHTFATELFRKGTDVKIVSSLLGHSSVDITYNIYIHVLQEQKVKAISKIPEIK
jgi:integrase